jgi:hypothetical protein
MRIRPKIPKTGRFKAEKGISNVCGNHNIFYNIFFDVLRKTTK